MSSSENMPQSSNSISRDIVEFKKAGYTELDKSFEGFQSKGFSTNFEVIRDEDLVEGPLIDHYRYAYSNVRLLVSELLSLKDNPPGELLMDITLVDGINIKVEDIAYKNELDGVPKLDVYKSIRSILASQDEININSFFGILENYDRLLDENSQNLSPISSVHEKKQALKLLGQFRLLIKTAEVA